MIQTRQSGDGVVFEVKVVAGASREEILTQPQGGALKVRLTAQREKGKANDALVRLLARALGVRRSDVQILRGHTATLKSVLVKGASAEKINSLARP